MTPSVTDALKRRRQNPASAASIYPELHDALAAAQGERDQYQQVGRDGEPAWVARERTVMLDATTALLIRHRLPIDADRISTAVRRAETRASGHVDYAHKWALGCAEYVAGVAAGARATQEAS